ncbi:MAG: hypothetical protein AB8B55_02660 [Mariniblastus sp.]
MYKFKLIFCLLFFGIFSFVGTSISQVSQSERSSESKEVESYLESLQLERLLIEHLEFESASESDSKKRLQIASRLIGLYAEQMMKPLVNDGVDWFSKSDLLMQTYPELSNPSIRIAMLQSKYLVNEKRFHDWWYQGHVEATKRDVVDDWRDLQSELTLFRRKLDSDYQELASSMRAISENRQLETEKLARLEGLILHCNYLSGWSAYFMGILNPEQRKQFMRESDSQFRIFLQIEPNKLLTEVLPSWFDFTSEWNSRALAGLAMCQRGLEHNDQAKYCFDLVESNAISQGTRDLRFLWELNSRLFLDQHVDGLEVLRSVSNSSAISAAGRIGFWMSTLKSAVATGAASFDVSQKMGRAGLIGLTREFQAPMIEKYLADNNLKLGTDDFLSLWITGYLEFSKAESSMNMVLAGELYQSAKHNLEKAVEIANSSSMIAPLDVARCRYLVGRIDFVKKDYARAAPTFEITSDLVFASDPQLSAESQWLAVRSFVELGSQNSRNQFKAMQAIDKLIERFPGSTFAKRAEFEKIKISLVNLPVEQALRRLSNVGPDDFNYPLALSEINKINYQRWLDAFKSKQDDEKTFEIRRELFKSEKKYRELARASSESKAKMMLLTVDALLRDQRSKNSDLRQRLNGVDRIIEDGKVTGAILQEYHYYQFQFANRMGDVEAAEQQATWLRENAQGTRFEQAALVQLAQKVDSWLKLAENPTQSDLLKAIEIYKRLAERLGTDSDSLKRSDNARVAYARLAEFKLLAGERDEATEMFENLVQTFPKNQNYLRMSAVVRTEAQQYEEALPIWQRLAAGVAAGSDIWFESKYWLAYCLMETGQKSQALELHKQTIRLSVDLPDQWKQRFEALLRSLSSQQ